MLMTIDTAKLYYITLTKENINPNIFPEFRKEIKELLVFLKEGF